MTDKYILDGKTPVPCEDLMTWGRFMEDREKMIVKQDKLPNDILVSTVFLGLDHQWGEGEPLLFETMIFGIKDSDYQERYSTWEEAEAGHQKAIESVFSV